jgi:hypothetical protein
MHVMSNQVKVEDIEVFRLFRAAMHKFALAVDQSLSGADSHISKTRTWLEGEQMNYWQSQNRKRGEAVIQAREKIRQKKLFKDASGGRRDASEEEKELARCLAAHAESQQKIEAIRKAIPQLDREADLYRGGVARLSATLGSDVPKAIGFLDNLATRLDEYMQIEAPGSADATGVAPSDAGMARGRDGETTHGSLNGESTTPPDGAKMEKDGEGRDVDSGQ